MDRTRRVQIQTGTGARDESVTEDQEPFMGVKVRRKASMHREFKGDYMDVPSRPYLLKILQKQGDRQVLFADKVLKFTGSGKMKCRILLITDFAIYIVDPEANALKRRMALAAVDKLCLSELNDNFFAIIVPSEYDCLMSSTRKTEIATVLVEATKSTSNYELEVVFSNSSLENCCSGKYLRTYQLLSFNSFKEEKKREREEEQRGGGSEGTPQPEFKAEKRQTAQRYTSMLFEYHATSELVKEVEFEEVEGGVKTRIMRK